MSLASQLSTAITAIGNKIRDNRLLDIHQIFLFDQRDPLTAAVGTMELPVLFNADIVVVKARLAVAPTGGTTFKVDVNKNGTTIYGTQGNRPIWTASAKDATVSTHSVTTVAAGDILTVDIDAIGSTIAGGKLVVGIGLRRTS